MHSSYDASTIYYHPMELNYDTKRRTIILEYAIDIDPLLEERHEFDMPDGNNFSFTGLEMSFVRYCLQNIPTVHSGFLCKIWSDPDLNTVLRYEAAC